MKKHISLFIVALALLTGCTIIESQKANWQACASDPACVEQAKNWQERSETVGGIVGGTAGSFIPGAAGVGEQVGKKAFGYVGLAIAMLAGGAAIRKKQQKPPAG